MSREGGRPGRFFLVPPINGTQPGKTGYQIDGVQASAGDGESGEDFLSPVPEQVEEVRVTDNTDATQRTNGGVTMEMITKSGTNQSTETHTTTTEITPLKHVTFSPRRPEEAE